MAKSCPMYEPPHTTHPSLLLHLEQEPLDLLHGLVEHGEEVAHGVAEDPQGVGKPGGVLELDGAEDAPPETHERERKRHAAQVGGVPEKA